MQRTGKPLLRQLLKFIFLSMLPDLALAQMPDNLSEIAKSSIVYIYFEKSDNLRNDVRFPIGTGFIVSRDGHVLTASHVLETYTKLPLLERSGVQIMGTIFDKPGSDSLGPYQLTLLDQGDADIALLKFSSLPPHAATAPVCFRKNDRSVKTGEQIFAFGFPYDRNFQPVPGTLGTQARSADGEIWAATSAFTYGMSGGPVYSSRGYVMGMVKGGLPQTEAVRSITPIKLAEVLLSRTTFQEKCDAPGEPLLGSWKAKYSCNDGVGEPVGQTSLRVTRNASGQLVADEDFSRKSPLFGDLVGHIKHEIQRQGPNLYRFKSQTTTWPLISYELVLKYDPQSETLTGAYINHPNCQTYAAKRAD